MLCVAYTEWHIKPFTLCDIMLNVMAPIKHSYMSCKHHVLCVGMFLVNCTSFFPYYSKCVFTYSKSWCHNTQDIDFHPKDIQIKDTLHNRLDCYAE
jgi:hypothetical protein